MNVPYKALALMAEQAVYLQPGYILQKRPYRETSLIMDVFTRDYGRLPLLAKGVRKAKSKTASLLQPFLPLLISYTGNANFKILTAVELSHPLALQGIPFYCGFYLNELLAFFIANADPHPEVFALYQQSLVNLTNHPELEATLRIFELQLLAIIGYALPLATDNQLRPIRPQQKYFFHPEQGAIASEQGVFDGETLLALQQQCFTDASQLAQAKQLMRGVIDFYRQGKPLKSRAVINQIIQQLQT